MSPAGTISMLFRIPRLKLAVERNHRCRATHIGTRVIVESLPDGSIWRGPVEVFEITGHPQTNRCYAWDEQRRVRNVCFTRLKIPPVESAQAAVRVVLARRILEPKLPAH